MMLKVPTEFLVVLSLTIDLFLIFLLLLFIRRANRLQRSPSPAQETDLGDIAAQTRKKAQVVAMEVLTETSEMIEPILEASKDAAMEFERLVQEKQTLTRKLDQSLDSKIISINLLLSRANTLYTQLENQHNSLLNALPKGGSALFQQETDVLDQQQRIIDLYYQKMDVDTIAERLSIPKGEVALVIDLKEKFIAMEKAR
jgi:flagellar motility protein MotE (MotC chaperone)